MGVCTSAPPVLVSGKAVEAIPQQENAYLKRESTSQPIAPVRVFRDNKVRNLSPIGQAADPPCSLYVICHTITAITAS